MQDNILVFPEPPPGDTAQFATPALPVSLTSLVGREQEVQAIHALLLRSDVRLLTLTGTAGVGKTRLAIEVARELAHDFGDGVHVVSLAPLSDPAFVIPTIAHCVGITESGSQPLLDQLKTSQRDKQRLLLLDNFEHVIEASPLLAELLEACPALKLLVTSREVLRLRAEHQLAVPPLALPDPRNLSDAGSLAHVPAVQLFLQRAQAIRSDFQLTTDNATTIAEICLRLDGLPLAIELAAARVKVLSLQALSRRLEHRLQLLTGSMRDLPERQYTLRNTIQWSYDLLSQEEQRLFRRLAVFVGGCTLEAVEGLCSMLGSGGISVLEGLTSLLDKSLLQHMEQRQGEPRLRMLETLREYGIEALEASGEMEATRQAHAHYYLLLAEEAEPELAGPQQAEWLERLEQAYDNLRAALLWYLERGEVEHNSEMALRLVGALGRFWEARGHWSEGWNFIERARAGSKGVAVSVQVKALNAAAYLLDHLENDIDRAQALYEEGLVLYRELGDRAGMALSLLHIGEIAGRRGNFAVASARTEEALALFRSVGDKRGIASSLTNLADIVSQQGEYARAVSLGEESLALFKVLGDMQGSAWSLINLAGIVSQQGDYARAISLGEESLALFRALGNLEGSIWSLFGLAGLLFLSQGDPARIHTLLEEGLALCKQVGHKLGIAWALSHLGAEVLQEGNAVKARSLLEESLPLYREGRDQRGIVESLSLLGRVEAFAGDYAAARTDYEESLAIGREVGDNLSMSFSLEGLATVVAVQGDPAWAGRLWGTAEALREAMGTPIPPVYRADYDHSLAAARAQLGEQAFATAWAEGRTMSLEQVLDASQRLSPTSGSSRSIKAMAQEPPVCSPEPAPLVSASLTPREVEVLRLLAQGLTSAHIAERLVIGVVTVNFHVRSIYSKLGVTSRSMATRYAMEHHLV